MDKTGPLSIIAALCVVVGALYALQVLTTLPLRSLPAETKAVTPPSDAATPSQQSRPAIEPPVSHPIAAITKCIVGGRTVYSDQPCAVGVKSDVVDIHDTAGLEPPKIPVVASYRQAPNSVVEPSNGRGGVIGMVNNSLSCDHFVREIDALDMIAKRPQAAAMQDWLRNRRLVLRSEQTAAGC